MATDATRCAKCGGEFSRKRIHVDGSAYHEGCVIMSYPSHTHDDMSRLSAGFYRMREALERIVVAGDAKKMRNIARAALTITEGQIK